MTVHDYSARTIGHQEPGDGNVIKALCSRNYDVRLPMFSKVDVNGDHAHPLFKHRTR